MFTRSSHTVAEALVLAIAIVPKRHLSLIALALRGDVLSRLVVAEVPAIRLGPRQTGIDDDDGEDGGEHGDANRIHCRLGCFGWLIFWEGSPCQNLCLSNCMAASGKHNYPFCRNNTALSCCMTMTEWGANGLDCASYDCNPAFGG